ncbi:MAG: glutathione S-transferase [Arenimonas sp.]
MPSLPLLYSFRRCPYAIRARLAIAVSGVEVQLHEVDLKAKPGRMLQLSPKGTVPVLELPNGRVIDESLDIMLWAFKQNDPGDLLNGFSEAASALIERNDNEFKQALDRYKYPERYPEFSMEHYRSQCEIFLNILNTRLANSRYFFGGGVGIADLALMPFIRQFASVDHNWFDASPYAALRYWLDAWLASDVFMQVMRKH